MKRMIPLLVVITLLLSMTLSSAATETTDGYSQNVTAKYVAGETGGDVISVNIAWTGMEFSYHDESAPVWDPEKHTYTGGTEAAWAKSDAYISITNHSNVILKASIAYDRGSGYEEMSLSFTDTAPYIGSAETVDGGEGEACQVTIRAIPMGTIDENAPTGSAAGQIKLSVTPADDHERILATIYELGNAMEMSYNATFNRGTVYFEPATDESSWQKLYYDTASELALAESVAQENKILNAYIKNYYNNLYLMQDDSITVTD